MLPLLQSNTLNVAQGTAIQARGNGCAETGFQVAFHAFAWPVPVALGAQDTGISARVEGHFRRGSVRCGAVRDVPGAWRGCVEVDRVRRRDPIGAWRRLLRRCG